MNALYLHGHVFTKKRVFMQQQSMQPYPSNENLLEQLYDIYDFMYVPLLNRTWFKVFLGVLLLILIIGCVFALYCWYRGKKKPAWERAIQALLALKAAPNTIQFFYDQSIIIVKKYLESIKQLPFKDKTDQELLEYLRTIVPPVLHDPLEKLLYRATVIKFADQQATVDDMNRDRACLIEVIESLRPTDQKK